MSQDIFLDPTVSSPPSLTPGSVGNGTLTVDKLTHFTITQDYTAVCTATDPFTTFDIIGSLDGAIGVAVVGTQFIDQDTKVFLTINQGAILFNVGDAFEFSVQQGTDLNQANLDAYDELPQKNFGTGITGENQGNHNLRFSEAAQLAFRNIQDLKFESMVPGALGNAISVEYFEGSLLAAAIKTIDDITYTASLPGSAGNNIEIEYIQFTAAVQALKNIQDIEYEAINAGVAGNLISIEYTGGGTAGSEVVNVIGNAISVQIEDGVSTADQIRLAVGSSVPAALLVDTISLGTGLEPQNIQAATFLENGADAIGDAGNEVVNVIGDLIQITLESGVSTAQQVHDAVFGSAAALTKVTPSITGIAATTQTAPQAAVNLENGTDAIGTPGNEVVNVVDAQIQVTFINSQSTAQQIKAAVEANIDAAALVTVSLIGEGQAETTDLEILATSDITNGESFVVNSANDVRTATFYYRIDSVDVPPGSGDDVAIDIQTGNSAFTNAVITAAAIDNEAEWDVANPASETIRVVNNLIGPSTDISNNDVGAGQVVPFNITKIEDGFDIGEELQTSPVARIFLGGGLGTGTYSFNTKEITDPGSFNEGNAAINYTGSTNQGDETTLGETTKKGKVTLDDDEPSNNSGPLVENTQKTINNLIQNGKCFIVTDDHERIEWSQPAGTISLLKDIRFIFTETGIINTIEAANFPLMLDEGESIWVRVDRLNAAILPITISNTVPDSLEGEDVFRLVTRNEDFLVWWDNTLQKPGKKIRIGEGAGIGAYQEKVGVANGVQTAFPIPSGLFPINEQSILVFGNAHKFITEEWTYNILQNQLEFVTAPEIGTEIYIYYLTDGETITPPSPSGVEQVIYHTVSVTEFTNKQLQLPVAPASGSKVLMDVIGGPSQVYAVDFNVVGDIIDWNGLGLDGEIDSGDQIRFHYYS